MTLFFAYTAPLGHTIAVQWYLNDVALVDGTYGSTVVSGATTTTLDIENPNADYNGQYYAIVSDLSVPGCSRRTDTITVTAFNCTLAITTQISEDICDIEITEQPVGSISVAIGDPVDISFDYFGFGGPFTVQWSKDGTPLADGPTGSGSTIAGATTTALSITNSQTTDSGSYTATVTDSSFDGCTATTDDSAVSVAGSLVPLPTAFWKLDENTPPFVGHVAAAGDRLDQVAGSTLFNQSPATDAYDEGQAGATASVYFPASLRHILDTGNIAGLAYTAGNDISVNLWVKFKEDVNGYEALPSIVVGLDADSELSIIGDTGGTPGTTLLDAFCLNLSTEDDIFIDPYAPTVDVWQMWTIVYSGGTGLFKFYANGSLIGTSTIPVNFLSSATGSVRLNSAFGPKSLLSQCGLWLDYALTPTDITNLYAGGTGITCCPFA